MSLLREKSSREESTDEERIMTPVGVSSVPGRRRVGLLAAIRRNWLLVLLPAVLLGASAVYYSGQREPTYTAESRLTVGRLDISAPGAISSFSSATQSLASAYSRTATARDIIEPVARRLNVPLAEATDRVSSSPIPESPVFRIEAKGPDPTSAVALSNAVSRSLVTYVTRLNRSNPDGDRLLRKYAAASDETQKLKRKLGRVKVVDSKNRTQRTKQRVDEATTELGKATLQLSTIRSAYEESQRSQASTALVQFVSPASKATSDRNRVLQFLLFVGIVGGLAIGIALAMLRTSRQVRRAQRV